MIAGVQVVSLLIILTVIFSYIQNKRIALLSTKFFTAFLLLTLLNIIFEFGTLYTIYNIETIKPWINKFCHQLFIGSLDLLFFSFFMYVDIKVRKQRRYNWKQLIIRLVPVAAAIIVVLTGKLKYHIGTDGRYSYGLMATITYISAGIYSVLVLYQMIKNKKYFNKQERMTVVSGILVWVTVALVQFFNPYMLITSMGIALMTLFVYLSFENPREYIDYEIEDVMNRHAYELMVSELIESKKEFYIINIMLQNTDILKNTVGYKKVLSLLKSVSQYLSQTTGETVYHSKQYALSVIMTRRGRYENFIGKKHCLETEGDIAKFQISILKSPEYAKTAEEIDDVLDFVNSEIHSEEGKIIIVDENIIDKRNYRATIERLIQKAIKEEGFEVYYQPIYSNKDKAFISAEALVRLKDRETLGFVSPEVFIPIAEKNGSIEELSNIVFEKVCEFISKNNVFKYGVEYIEVNLSGVQSADKYLKERLTKCMDKYGITPNNINLEITETVSVEVGEKLLSNMEKLRSCGFKFSMDDFGTGYSNLAQMAKIKFELIKLDKSLIWPCFEKNNKEAKVILNSCIDMILKLGREIVAEGVETKEQVDYLTQRGVNYLQGYYFAKPMPENDYLEYLKKNGKKFSQDMQ